MSAKDIFGISAGASGSRALALGLLIVALLLMWFGAVAPYRAALMRSEQGLNAAREQLRQVRLLVAPEKPDNKPVDEAIAPLLLPGASRAAAAASLQQLTGALALQAGAMILSFELLPDAQPTDGPGVELPLQAVAGRVRMTGDSGALRALLHGLESRRPLLRLDNLFIRARSDRDAIPGGHLDIQLDVTGYRIDPKESG